MSTEVIQETSYDGRADVWSLGITALELCEGQPPHYNVHPMRAIFMIPMKPAPTLKDPAMWSAEMVDFLSKCLVKSAEMRATTEKLLEHRWILEDVHRIRQGRGLPVLVQLVHDNMDAIRRMRAGDEEVAGGAANEDDKNKTLETHRQHQGSTRKSIVMSGGGADGTYNKKRSDSFRRVAPQAGMPDSRDNRGAMGQREEHPQNSFIAHGYQQSSMRSSTPGGEDYSATFKRDVPYNAGGGTVVRVDRDVPYDRESNMNWQPPPLPPPHMEREKERAKDTLKRTPGPPITTNDVLGSTPRPPPPVTVITAPVLSTGEQLSNTVQRSADGTRAQCSDELKEALQYFRYAPTVRATSAMSAVKDQLDANGVKNPEAIGQQVSQIECETKCLYTKIIFWLCCVFPPQEIQRQMQDLDRQFQVEMDELKKAYGLRKQQLLGALGRAPTEGKPGDSKVVR